MAALLAVSLLPAAEAQTTPLHITITGPSIVAVKEIHEYVITSVGGPGEGVGGNYSMTANIIGPKVTDGVVTPGNANDRNGSFRVDVTMPSVAQDMVLRVTVSSFAGTTGVELENVTRDYPIKIVTPIVITVKVVNSGQIAVGNVPIEFFADGAKIFNTTVSIAANSSATVQYNWTTVSLSVGTHDITVQLDPSNEFVRFEGGGAVFTQTIYYGSPNYGSSDGLIVVLIAFLLFTSYIVYRRPKRKRKK